MNDFEPERLGNFSEIEVAKPHKEAFSVTNSTKQLYKMCIHDTGKVCLRVRYRDESRKIFMRL